MQLKHIFGIILGATALHAKAVEPVDYVNPLIGTLSKFELSTGNNYPAIAMPWGMNFWMPQTGDMGDGWAYTYTADKIKGFKQTHQPSPWMNDYGQFALMPTVGQPVFDQKERASWFSHKSEIAKPYYYKVYLADYDVTTELTPTERCAIFRFTFPATEQAHVVLDAFDRGSYVKIIPQENKIMGYTTRNSGGVPANFRNYFVAVFDAPFSQVATADGGNITTGQTELSANHSGAVVSFDTRQKRQIMVRVASSFISMEQAELNLQRETGNSDFEQLCEAGRRQWNTTLSRIEVKDNNIDHLRTFYSCLYRTVLFPRSFYEINRQGNIVHYSPYNGQVHDGYLFTDTGFWDTFRSLFPFLNLMYPSMAEKMQEGLVNAYRESGFLPEWASPGHRDCMVGNNSASVVADAYLKGLRGYDIETLWQAVKHGANNVLGAGTASGRLGYEHYNQLGYVPNNVGIGQSVARTLEYAYDDWCIYKLGKALGKSNDEIAPYAKRAMNYRQVFDAESNLMRGRATDGNFAPNFNPASWSIDFCEGNSWHYSWSVFHDPAGLINLMGGETAFAQMLDSVFVLPSNQGLDTRSMIHEMREMQIMNMGQYAHGNQPIQHMIYLYNYCGQPWKTQYWAREVMDKLYAATPDGYCGDEDNGQTSAWYVLSSLGFYTVCPGSDQYILGSPLFGEACLHLENGNTVRITANSNTAQTRYVKQMRLNGKLYTHNYLTHKQLTDGAKLSFDMADTPNTQRGLKVSDRPYSFSNEQNEQR